LELLLELHIGTQRTIRFSILCLFSQLHILRYIRHFMTLHAVRVIWQDYFCTANQK